MARDYPFLDLDIYDAKIRVLEMYIETQNRELAKVAEANHLGIALEKEGRVDEAIQVYEALVAEQVDTPHTYRRLAILFRKQKRPEEEIRILHTAILATEGNPSHQNWFRNRLQKIEQLKGRPS